MYDVFISHKSDCKPWVRTLARNLKAQGFKVFFDEWELIAGNKLAESLSNGLKQSSKGILVLTPGVFESEWVIKEFNQMMEQTRENQGFTIIPVVLDDDIPDLIFLEDIIWLDFRDHTRYLESFYRLVCTIEGRPPGRHIDLDSEITIPPPLSKETKKPGKDEISFVTGLFKLFKKRQAILLLAQEDRWLWTAKTCIKAQAQIQFGEKNILHIIPPLSSEEDMKEFFSLLGKQCGFKQRITSPALLQAAFEKQLRNGQPLLLMVSGFENICQKGQKGLAGVLRSLNELFPRNLRILICGGRKLEDLYYSGELSYLNHAKTCAWPELTVNDVLRIAKHMSNHQQLNGVEIDEETSKKILEISGGHPRLVEHCFDLYVQNPKFDKNSLTEDLIIHSPVVWQLFTPFRKNSLEVQDVCQLLKNDDVGPAQPYITDPLLRRLYWMNLIKQGKTNSRLYWRCDALREVGQKILACDNTYV